MKRKLHRPKSIKDSLTIAKTNGFTIADADLVLALQIANLAEDRWRRDPTAFSATFGPTFAKNLAEAKRKGLVSWRYRRTTGDKTTIAWIKLTRKGMKVLTVGGGRVFLNPKS